MFSNIKNNAKKAEFTIFDVDLSVVNSIRRIILSEIPCAAFDQEEDILINLNKGVLHNEFIAHRISLVPLYLSEDEFENVSDYTFILKKKNITADTVSVTTKDFEIYDKDNYKLPDTFREHVFPKDPITKDYILITKLRPNLYDNDQGEELDIECKATINTATKHARWGVVSQCSFYNTIDQEAYQKAFSEATKSLSKEEKKKVESRFNTLEKYRYFKKNKYDEPNSFEFVVESECRLTPKLILTKALQILKEKVINFSKSFSDLKIHTIMPNFYQIEIKNQNHTLLNVIQSLIYNKHFRNPDNVLDYIGYYQSHPLDDIMYLKIKFNDNIDLNTFLNDSCLDIVKYLENISDQITQDFK
jgi:DNA-directed RNA polymerase subunit L